MKGAKAEGLEKLLKLGLNVPPFHVFTHDAFDTLSGDFSQDKLLLEQLISTLPFRAEKYAVRSSSSIEDSSQKSFAGQFKTVLFVRQEELSRAVFDVWLHFKELQTTDYNAVTDAPFGIIVQEMITPDLAGIAFSVHPQDGDTETPFISVIPGSGEPLVSGLTEGCDFTYDNQWKTNQSEAVFEGKVEEHTVRLTGKQIKEHYEQRFFEIAETLKRLKSLTGCDVDTELAIKSNVIYWLQVRPITVKPPKSIGIWDNTATEINFPGLTSPLTLSFLKESYALAYGNLAARLGFRQHAEFNEQLRNMCGGINGRFYYNVPAWQELICLLPFGSRVAGHLPHLWGMEPLPERVFKKSSFLKQTAVFFKLTGLVFRAKKLKSEYIKLIAKHLQQKTAIGNKTEKELIQLFRDSEQQLAQQWIAPVVNGFYTALHLALFRKAINGTRLEKDHPNFLNDILQSQTSVVTVRMVLDFHLLLDFIRSDKQLKDDFIAYSANELMPVIAEKHTAFHEKFNAYLRDYGVKAVSSELKLETETFEQQPALLIEQLQNSIDAPTIRLSEPIPYKQHIREYYPVYHPGRYWRIYLANQCKFRVAERENFRFNRTQVFDLFRQIVLLLEKKWLAEGKLEAKGDVFYLTREELLAGRNDYRTLIAERKSAYASYAKLPETSRYKEYTDGFIPVSTEVVSGSLKGTGCSSGIVKGKVFTPDTIHLATPEDTIILIAPFFEPGDIRIFAKAQGIISERGNILSHTAILAREMKIPAIVGVKGLLNAISPGTIIEMNGSSGTIQIPEHE